MNLEKFTRLSFTLSLLCASVAACGSPAGLQELLPTPTTQLELPTVFPSPTFTQMPSPSATFPPATATLTPDLSTPTSPAPGENPNPTPVPPGPASTPGGLIAFQSDRGGNNDIYVMNTDGSNVRQVSFGALDDRVASWSPDGRYIAFQSNRDGDYEIFVVELATLDEIQVTYNGCDDYAPNWSPDGGRFAFYSNCDGNREIFTIQVDGSNRNQLTETQDTYNWFPTWSPDGKKIIFASNPSGGKYRIYQMNANGSNLKEIGPGCMPSMSPDDRMVLFAEYCLDSGNILMMDKDGSQVWVVNEDGNNRNPNWSPDGSKIVYQSESSGNFEIWLMDADGGNRVRLTNHRAEDAAPVWGP